MARRRQMRAVANLNKLDRLRRRGHPLRLPILRAQTPVVDDDRARPRVRDRGSARSSASLQSAIMRPPPGVPSDVALVLVRRMARPEGAALWSRARFSYPRVARDEQAAHDVLRRHGLDGEHRRRRRGGRAGSARGESSIRHRRLFLRPWLASSLRLRACRRRHPPAPAESHLLP